MALTGKTIGQLTYLSGVTTDTLFPVELSGDTYHIAYSAFTNSNYNEGTYDNLYSFATGGTLTAGSYYLMTNFQTCYDQPNYDNVKVPITTGNYKTGTTEPILLLAISTTGFSPTVYSTLYPNDKITYDITWNTTEITSSPAKGRITERIDNFNNRTDYDNRSILFKRYNGYSYNENNPLSGLVGISGITGTTGVLYGNTGTTFTSNFSTGDIVSVQNVNPSFFEIISVESDSLAIISGVTINVITDSPYYYGNDDGVMSYYQPNIRQDQVYEYTTFDYGYLYGGGAVNNYIGNHSNLYLEFGVGDFLLANNVFINDDDYEYRNNTIGDGSYNNTFNDDCDNNQIGDSFYNNSTNDDFDGNIIGEGFNNNYIASNFNNNRIGSDFNYNTLLGGSFYRNNIGNNFEYNVWTDGNFQNNEIGNQFNNNNIYNDFYKNDIGNGYNGNDVYSYFYGNLIGNGYNNNNIYCQFYDNKIGEYYIDNTLGDINNPYTYEFYSNQIGNQFQDNGITANTHNNVIGNEFENNTILDDFYNNQIFNEFKGNITYGQFYFNKTDWGFSANEFSGECGNNTFGPFTLSNDFLGDVYSNTFKSNCYDNVIGDNFINNNIGESFYDNNISDGFQYNQIGSLFNNNTIGENFGFGYAFPQGNKIGNNFYNNIVGEYFYNNTIPDNFRSNQIDDSFQWNIVNAEINGTCLSTGMLYDPTTVNVFKNKNGDDRLSYYDEFDVLTIETLTESPCFNLASFTITSSDFTFGGDIYQDTTPLGVDGVDGFENTASQGNLYQGYYGTGLSGTSLSELTTAYNNLGLSLNNSVGRLWYVTWGPGSSIPSGIVKFGAYNNGENFEIQTIDTSDTNYLTPNTGDGTSLVGTFLFPATFTIYEPLTDKDGWC